MIFTRLAWLLAVMMFIAGLLSLLAAGISLTDPDTWPSANPPGKAHTHGKGNFALGLALIPLALGMAALAEINGSPKKWAENGARGDAP